MRAPAVKQGDEPGVNVRRREVLNADGTPFCPNAGGRCTEQGGGPARVPDRDRGLAAYSGRSEKQREDTRVVSLLSRIRNLTD